MCLKIDEVRTKAALDSRPKDGFVTRYKVIWRRKYGLSSPCFPYHWLLGENTSKAGRQQGFHVLLNEIDTNSVRISLSEYFTSDKLAVIQLKCYNKDLLGVGNWAGLESELYFKVTLEQEVYDKCLFGKINHD